jgi:hypothetical protein
VQKQSDVDTIPCVICGYPQGDDNIVLCDGCNRCFHLRCLLPPRSIVPSGDWYCPGCDIFIGPNAHLRIDELKDKQTPLQYSQHDPYVNFRLLDYGRTNHCVELLRGLPPKALYVRRNCSYLKKHPTIDDWLLVYKKIRHVEPRWLVLPPVEYRWDIIAMIHDIWVTLVCHKL